MEFVLIDGWWGSGKGGIAYLLDSHSRCFVDFSQSAWIELLMEAELWGLRPPFSLSDMEDLPSFNTLFMRMEGYSRSGLPIYFSANNKQIVPFLFDYSRFRGELLNRLPYCLSTKEQVRIYSKLFVENANWQAGDYEYFLALGVNHAGTVEFCCRNGIKYIYIDRKAADVISALCRDDAVKRNWLSWIKSDIPDLLGRRSRVLDCKSTYPDLICAIKFNEFYESEIGVDKISFFLNIHGLNRRNASLMGHPLRRFEENYFDKRLDRAKLSHRFISMFGSMKYFFRKLSAVGRAGWF